MTSKRGGTPPHQVTLMLTPKQHAFIEARLKEARKADPYARKSEVLRDVMTAGITTLEERT